MFCAPKLLIYFQLVEHMCLVFSKPCHSSCNARFHISDVFSSRNSMTFGRSTSQNDFLFFSFSSFFRGIHHGFHQDRHFYTRRLRSMRRRWLPHLQKESLVAIQDTMRSPPMTVARTGVRCVASLPVNLNDQVNKFHKWVVFKLLANQKTRWSHVDLQGPTSQLGWTTGDRTPVHLFWGKCISVLDFCFWCPNVFFLQKCVQLSCLLLCDWIHEAASISSTWSAKKVLP